MSTPVTPSVPPIPPSHPPPSPFQARLLKRFPRLHRLHLLSPSIPLPTLLGSFLILHELTAILPIFGIFYGLRSIDGGSHILRSLTSFESTVRSGLGTTRPAGEGWVHSWAEESEKQVERVGKRYGILGFEKEARKKLTFGEFGGPGRGDPLPVPRVRGTDEEEAAREVKMKESQGKIAVNVANALGALVICKILLPARLASTFYLAPHFARGFLMPINKRVARVGAFFK